MRKKISVMGIIICTLYFISVGTFLLTQSEWALTGWEFMTIAGAVAELFVLIEISSIFEVACIRKEAMLVFMGCACALSGGAHIVNITVTRRLIREGVFVPEYFRIGCWPSVEMVVDFLAWGFFVGLAFLAISLGIHVTDKQKKILQVMTAVCGFLCLAGFFGAITINDNLWYIAPMGYGVGVLIICIQMLRIPCEGK